ncbi:PilW family protein [Legionella fairfieldensis]|uniref:PilW family protein n=1 Tax=Legionella fairfieldensis TaxID=45064 RepID=UPI000684BD0A|nr:prepilin-type N-terminal cleavage/methylation domain-containing protein [Legionella fairfieldensis]
MSRQQGISLVELLIGLFLTGFLVTIMMQHYLASKRQYRYVQSLLDQSYELQLVSDLIRNSVRHAGFTPCRGLNALQVVDRRDSRSASNSAIAMQSGKKTGFSIHRMSEYFSSVIKSISPTKLFLKAGVLYQEGQTILIADCYHAEIQQIEHVQSNKTGSIIRLTKPLMFDYVMPVYVGEWIEEAFFIQKNQQGRQSLFYQQKHAEELGSLINNLSVEINSFKEKKRVRVILSMNTSQRIEIDTGIRTL